MTDYLVTGGAGFLGSALVERLAERRDVGRIRVLDDFSRGFPRRLEGVLNRVETVEADVRERSAVFDAVDGVDVVVHLAAVNGTRNFYESPDRVLEVGVKGTYHTMEASVEHRCGRYLLASSSEVYQQPPQLPTPEDVRLVVPDPSNPRYSYGGSKILGELLAHHVLGRHGIHVNIVRPHNIYGPDMGSDHVVPEFALRLAGMSEKSADTNDRMKFSIEGTGEETRAFCFVDDAVDGIETILNVGEPGATYNVGTEEEVTIAELARRMAQIAGVTIDLSPGQRREGSTSRRCPDITALKGMGYRPSVSLEEGLRCTYNWYRCHGSIARFKSEEDCNE